MQEGWFVAPETTDYRFYMSCDDRCTFNLGKNDPDVKPTQDKMVKILESGYHVGRRLYWHKTYRTEGSTYPDTQVHSAWVSLVKGKKYFFQHQHVE